MAVDLAARYINVTPGTPSYPQGSFKNATGPGLLDGTPLEEAWTNDVWGLLYAMLGAAGITPTDTVDTALLSQHFQAMKYVAGHNDYDALIDYDIGSIAIGSDDIWYEATAANGPTTSAVNPVGDTTGTWKRFLSQKMVSLSGGGALLPFIFYELTDSNTYTLPLAANVPANGWVWLELPDTYSDQTPLIQRSGSDTITDINGTDTEVGFNTFSSTWVRFISDGASDWRI